MLDHLARHWWVLALRGALAILFGILAFLLPGITLYVLVLFFGAYALLDGIFALATAFRFGSRDERWWPLVIEGVCGIVAGVLTFLWPGITAVALIYLIAAWAILTGILEIAAAIRLRKEIEGEWLLGLTGVLSVLLGIFLMLMPGAGLLAWVWMVGAYALLFGILLLILAFRLRSLTHPPVSHQPVA
jgi:uncharacterized membrane protein HdeD (DUF308 family)